MSEGKFLVFVILLSLAVGGCPFAGKVKQSQLDEVADPETTTPKGCKCASLCGPSVEDGFTVSFCQTAKVVSNDLQTIAGLVLH